MSRTDAIIKFSDSLEDLTGIVMSVGQLATFLFLIFLLAPDFVERTFAEFSLTNYVDQACVVLLTAMFVSSPLILFSASVGIWRMRELSRSWRSMGLMFGVMLFIQGLANATIPVAVYFHRYHGT